MSVAFRVIVEDQPMGYHPVIARVCGGLAEGVMIGRLLYWDGVMARKYGDHYSGEFYKSDDELRDETGLSLSELKTSKKHLKELGFIAIDVRGIPPTSHYTLKIDTIQSAIEKGAPPETDKRLRGERGRFTTTANQLTTNGELKDQESVNQSTEKRPDIQYYTQDSIQDNIVESKNDSTLPNKEYLPESPTPVKEREPITIDGIDFLPSEPRGTFTKEERIQSIANAIDTAMAREGTAVEVAASIANPYAERKAFVNRYAPLVAKVMGRGQPISEDRGAAGDILKFHCDTDWLVQTLTNLCGDVGDQYRHLTKDGRKPVAYWLRDHIEREWAEHKGQLHDTRQREQSRAEYERECREAIEAAERGTLFQGWKPDPPPASVYLHGADAGTLRDAAGDELGDEGIAVAAARELRVQPDGLAVRPVSRGQVDCYSRGRVPKMQRQARAVSGMRNGEGPGSSASAVDAGIHPRQPAPGRDADGTD